MAGHDGTYEEWLVKASTAEEQCKWDIISGSDVDIAHQATEFRSWLVSQGSIPIQISNVSSMIPVLKLAIDGSWWWNRNLHDPTLDVTCQPINTFRWHWSEDGSVFVTNGVSTAFDGAHAIEAVFRPPPGVNLVLRPRPLVPATNLNFDEID